MKMIVLLLSMGVTGCASLTPIIPVIAVLEDDLFTGQVRQHLDGSSTLEVQSALDSSRRCMGVAKYTAPGNGVVDFTCNDGATGRLAFRTLTLTTGYGYGSTSRGPASFAYGMTAEEAEPYLTLPKGKRITKTHKGPRLTDV